MSVLVIGKFKGDTVKFRQALADRADEFAKIADGAKTVGALHHRFGVGDGYVSSSTNGRASSTSRSSWPTRTCRPSSDRSALPPNRPRSSWPRRSPRRTSSDGLRRGLTHTGRALGEGPAAGISAA
jgi:hypothetical protein